jgi:hypothetical protein
MICLLFSSPRFSVVVCLVILLSCRSITSFLLPYCNVRKVRSPHMNLISSSSSIGSFKKSNIAKSPSPLCLNYAKSSQRFATSKAMISCSLLDEKLLPSPSVFDFLPSSKQFLFFSVLFASALFHQQLLHSACNTIKKIPRLLRASQSRHHKHTIVSVDELGSSFPSGKTSSTDEETKAKKNSQLANPWKVCRFERKEILNHKYVLYKFRIIPSLPSSSEEEGVISSSHQKNLPDSSHPLSGEVGKKVSISLVSLLFFCLVSLFVCLFVFRFF